LAQVCVVVDAAPKRLTNERRRNVEEGLHVTYLLRTHMCNTERRKECMSKST